MGEWEFSVVEQCHYMYETVGHSGAHAHLVWILQCCLLAVPSVILNPLPALTPPRCLFIASSARASPSSHSQHSAWEDTQISASVASGPRLRFCHGLHRYTQSTASRVLHERPMEAERECDAGTREIFPT